jgi:hypothetical protein
MHKKRCPIHPLILEEGLKWITVWNAQGITGTPEFIQNWGMQNDLLAQLL